MFPVTFEGFHTTFVIDQPCNGVVLMTIAGSDGGEHGDGPMRVLDELLAKAPFTFFIDTRRSRGASINVSNEWAYWLRKNRARLDGIHMLTGSRFIQLTADFVRRFAELGDSMRIYTDGAAFDEALAATIASHRGC